MLNFLEMIAAFDLQAAAKTGGSGKVFISTVQCSP
jgi:hypothetical protein